MRSKLRKFPCLLPIVSASSTLVRLSLSKFSRRLAENDLRRINRKFATCESCCRTLRSRFAYRFRLLPNRHNGHRIEVMTIRGPWVTYLCLRGSSSSGSVAVMFRVVEVLGVSVSFLWFSTSMSNKIS